MWSCNDFMGPLLYVSTPGKYPMSLFVKLSMDGDTGFAWNKILALSLISILPQLMFSSVHRTSSLKVFCWCRQGLSPCPAAQRASDANNTPCAVPVEGTGGVLFVSDVSPSGTCCTLHNIVP